MIYKITLFDANFPSCTSGTASFFTEDIDEFEHNYFSDENVESNHLEAQKQRYFHSSLHTVQPAQSQATHASFTTTATPRSRSRGPP